MKNENTIEATIEMQSALSAIKKAVRADAKASHLTAWALSRLVNDGDSIDEAVACFKDYLRADEGVDAKKAAAIVNAARHYVPYMVDIINHLDVISHTRQNHPAVNALYKDGHVTLCNESMVFDDPSWEMHKSDRMEHVPFYHRIFQLIGGKSVPEL